MLQQNLNNSTTIPGSSATRPSLLIRGLKKAFADVKAVDDIDLEVHSGECFGLLGPNGAGKTTTIEICEGLTEPDSGTVEILGLNWKTGPHGRRDPAPFQELLSPRHRYRRVHQDGAA
jgi:ABC-type Fe3+/spermidine/putrescine transport system ATPase subunit